MSAPQLLNSSASIVAMRSSPSMASLTLPGNVTLHDFVR